MAERQASTGQTQRPSRATITTAPAGATSSFLRKLHENVPNSAQLFGIFTLIISGGILLLLTGFTFTAVTLGFIFLAPLVILSSPIWFPIGSLLFLTAAGFISFCGFGVAVMVVTSWLYKYFRGLHPPGSDRVDYARSRIADTASHVKDYAREYGGYLHSKVKDAAPGA